MLWIAFKNWYLWRYKQPGYVSIYIYIRCELLSRIGIFDVINNQAHLAHNTAMVVNCFQELVSLTL